MNGRFVNPLLKAVRQFQDALRNFRQQCPRVVLLDGLEQPAAEFPVADGPPVFGLSVRAPRTFLWYRLRYVRPA